MTKKREKTSSIFSQKGNLISRRPQGPGTSRNNTFATTHPAPMRFCVECFNMLCPTAKSNGGSLQLAWCCRCTRRHGKNMVVWVPRHACCPPVVAGCQPAHPEHPGRLQVGCTQRTLHLPRGTGEGSPGHSLSPACGAPCSPARTRAAPAPRTARFTNQSRTGPTSWALKTNRLRKKNTLHLPPWRKPATVVFGVSHTRVRVPAGDVFFLGPARE